VSREEIAVRRRRQEASDSLEFEREREVALEARLEPLIRDLEAWRADELAFGRMSPEDAATLREVGFAMGQLPDQGRAQRESQVAELEAQLADCRRRQRAFAAYVEALDGLAAKSAPGREH
jgi:hypothetical protein